MKLKLFSLLFFMTGQFSFAQDISVDLTHNWQFFHPTTKKWYKATVPGTIHTDLLNNQLIPDPYYRDNESKLQWIDQVDWDYKTVFNIDHATFAKKNIELVFDGLDTYADVFLNGKLVLQSDNMFRGWTVDVKNLVKRTNNELFIKFYSARNRVDSIARSKLPLVLPDNPRVYVRKAQFQFGWDWGPKFTGCGIWKKVKLVASDVHVVVTTLPFVCTPNKLIREKDSTGTSFYFESAGKPVYVKGANWIPGDMFLPRLKKQDYRRMLLRAKNANMNMLRVWGGGIYEDDCFYDLCDSLGIMVWQDFMFAGGMIPGDTGFFDNVREEVRYQLKRLQHHCCIVLWCGNNEIDEAWNNWGWQEQFNLHGSDSAKIYSDYKRMFDDSLKKWVNEFDGTRPYISTSPLHGWGHEESFKEGDSHYWGLWWGLEDWEVFQQKTGRFVSEYGMQAMPNMNTIKGFTDKEDRMMNSPVILAHQKAGEGFKKLDHYLTRYFIDSDKLSKLSLEDYTYLTQCLQYYILKNSIAVQRSKFPVNRGTLLWQLNDCWPVTSWSITDYSRQPKAAWYAVKEAYRDDILPVPDTRYPKDLELEKPVFTIKKYAANRYSIVSTKDARYVYIYKEDAALEISDNYFDLKAGVPKLFSVTSGSISKEIKDIRVKSLYDVLYVP